MGAGRRWVRPALLVLPGAIPAKVRREWEGELRWIGRARGRVRDCDVELEHVRRRVAQATEPERTALLVFLNRVEIKRARRRAKLLEKVDSPRFAELRNRAKPWIEIRPGVRPLRD